MALFALNGKHIVLSKIIQTKFENQFSQQLICVSLILFLHTFTLLSTSSHLLLIRSKCFFLLLFRIYRKKIFICDFKYLYLFFCTFIIRFSRFLFRKSFCLILCFCLLYPLIPLTCHLLVYVHLFFISGLFEDIRLKLLINAISLNMRFFLLVVVKFQRHKKKKLKPGMGMAN